MERAEWLKDMRDKYHPSLEQVRAWVGQAGLVIEEEGTGNWYEHFVVRKSQEGIL